MSCETTPDADVYVWVVHLSGSKDAISAFATKKRAKVWGEKKLDGDVE